MKKISAFFGFSLCEEDFCRIAKKTSFQAMKEKSKEMHGKSGDILFQKGRSLQMENQPFKVEPQKEF